MIPLALDFSQQLAYVVAGVVLLITAIYWATTRNAGREDDERKHEKQVAEELETMMRSPAAYAGADDFIEGIQVDIDYLCRERETARLVERLRAKLYRALAPGIVAHGRRIEDATLRDIHVAWVDGYLLAHRDPDALMDDVEIVLEALSTGEKPPATFSEFYAEDIQEGRVDIEASKARVRGDCKLRIQSNLRKQKEIKHGKLVDRLVFDDDFRYPPDVVRQKIDEMLGRDIRGEKDGTLVYQRYT